MTVVWILLGKLRYPATLIQGSPEQGIEEAKIPFDLAGDFVPDLLRARDAELAARVEDPAGEGFGAILHRDATMVAAMRPSPFLPPASTPAPSSARCSSARWAKG
jgi:hypothetical protein